MDDDNIIALFLERSERAIDETAKKYGNYCRKIALNILASAEDAEECVNDALLRAWNSIPPHKPERLSTYLGKITRNLSLNRYEKSTAEKRGGGQVPAALEELEGCLSLAASVESETDNNLLAAAISAWLSGLTEDSRVIFVRRYWYLDSISDVAELFGISESKTKSILFRLRKDLKKYFEKEGICL